MSRRGDVLDALRAAGARGVSGETLADRFGVSRAAIAKHVSALRGLGYSIDATPGLGYLLRAAPDLALPDEVAPLVVDPLWVRFEGGMETASTNDDAKALARAGAPEGTVVLAARQTAGRGRLGRSWESPDGGVYLSVVLRPGRAPAQLGALSLAIGLGVARGLDAFGCASTLKWPNDVWLGAPGERGSGKLAGILLEMAAESESVEWLVAGIGVNVRPGRIRAGGAAYVAEASGADGDPVGTAAVAAAVLDGAAGAYREFLVAGFASLLPEYEGRSVLGGRAVVVRDREGAPYAEGRVLGVDPDGRLVLEGPAGRTTVSAGDVTLAGSLPTTA